MMNEAAKIKNPLAATPNFVEWFQTIELGYDEPSPQETICFCCGRAASATATAEEAGDDDNNNNNNDKDDKEKKKLSKCSKCNIAAYCGRDCQIKDWKSGGHKKACASYQQLSSLTSDDESTVTATKVAVRNQIYQRIRFYACPYAVWKSSELGNGFLFLQSDTTLQDLSLAIPKDASGRQLLEPRAVLLHYLTLGEYDAEVCKDDFEMALVRPKLQELVEKSHDPEKEVVILMRLRCGHVALGKAVLVPDYRVCMQLGKDYYADNTAGAIQLNLDDL